MFEHGKKASITILAATLAVGLVWSGVGQSAPPAGKGGGKDKGGGTRVIKFSRTKNATGEIITVDESGGNNFTVVRGAGLAGGGASWSPDGLWLGGYERKRSDAPYDDAFMRIRADGTGEQVVVTYPEIDAFNVANGKKSLYALGTGFGTLGRAAWGPDGTMVCVANVVYTTTIVPDDGDPYEYDYIVSRLFLVNVETGDLFQLTDDDGNYGDSAPHYSPALGKIVFVSGRTLMGTQETGFYQVAELFAINPDGTGLQRITHFEGPRIWSARWNHAGTALAASLETPGGAVGANSDIWILEVDLDLPDPVTFSFPLRDDPGKTEGSASWSPDDSCLVFQRWWRANARTKRYQIVSLDLGSDQETLLVESKNTSVHGPDWNPLPPAE